MTNEETNESKFQVVYADTDTLSSFLNRNCFEYFMKVFEMLEAEVIISRSVYNELMFKGKNSDFRIAQVEQITRTKRIKIEDIDLFSDVGDTYMELSERMGEGEASALALAKHCNKKAVVASNNMSDVAKYAEQNSIELWPTARILEKAVELNIMNLDRANGLWKKMKENGLRLPEYSTLEEYCNNK